MNTIWIPHTTFNGVIDVSHNNGVIKWSQVPADILLVFVKATQGIAFTDPQYAKNIEGARDTNRLTVPYHFLTAEDTAQQLAHFQLVTGLKPGQAAMVDWEVDPVAHARPPIATMGSFCLRLASVLGRGPLCYHGMYDLSSPTINQFPWFIPKYGPAPRGPKYLLWQDRPDLRVAGIPNLTDHSVFSGTEDELRAWVASGTMPAGF